LVECIAGCGIKNYSHTSSSDAFVHWRDSIEVAPRCRSTERLSVGRICDRTLALPEITHETHSHRHLPSGLGRRDSSVYRPIGRYRRSKRRKSLTPLNVTRHLLCVHFRLLTARSVQKKSVFGVRVSRVRVSSRSCVLATSFKDAIDFVCLERR